MVNTGKPSGGCRLCRARRIKCDERKPFCLRCEKSKRQCPGYRDPFETKIRDETEATISKFTSQAQPVGRPAFQGIHPDANQSGRPQRRTPLPGHLGQDFDHFINRITQSLPVPVDEQASCYFLSDFVLLPSRPGAYGYHQFIYGLFQKDKILPAFAMAFKAVSIMGLSRRPNCRPLELQAQAFYGKALWEVNRALHNSSQMHNDQITAAVLLLAFYESLSSGGSNIDGYSNHLRGAALLLRARGASVHETPEGHEMFQLVRHQLLTFRQMPGAALEDYSWLVEHNADNPNIDAVINQMTRNMFDVRQQTDRLTRTPQNPKVLKELSELLSKAQGLLSKMAKPPMQPEVLWPEDEDDISDSARRFITFPGRPVNVFVNIHTALMYVVSWLSKLLLTTSIFRVMAAIYGPDAHKTKDGYDEIATMARDCVRELVSTIPFLLGWKGKDKVKTTLSPCGDSANENPLKGAIGSMIQWPLFVASVSDFATEKQKIFLRGRLAYLSDVVRIKQAGAFLAMAHHATPSRIILEDIQARDRGQSYPTPETEYSPSPPDSGSSAQPQ